MQVCYYIINVLRQNYAIAEVSSVREDGLGRKSVYRKMFLIIILIIKREQLEQKYFTH